MQVSELPMVLRAMIDFDQTSGGGVSVMNPVEHFSSRFRSRLHNKGGMSLLPSPASPNPSEYISSSSPRSNYGIGELNRRITDLKVDHPPAISPPHNFMRDSSPKLLELGQNYSPNNPNHYQHSTTLQLGQIRRDSNNSTTSSSYYSMKSCDVSRRSSNQSHTSSVSTIRPSNVASAANFQNYDPNFFYDPISAGSSRRSSQLSTADNVNYGPPSSQLLSSHLARLQRHSTASSHQYPSAAFYHQNSHPYSYNPYAAMQGNNLMMQHQQSHMFYNYGVPSSHQNFNEIRSQMPTSSTDRRMSEPISNASRNVQSDFARPRSTTPTKSLLEPKKEKEPPQQKSKREKSEKGTCKEKGSPSKPHPNETVLLDVLKTNEKIENCDELVIPDDMVQFITSHAGDDDGTNVKLKIKLDLDDEIEPMSSSISIEKIKEEDLLTLLAEVDNGVKSNEEENDVKNGNSEASANQIPNDFNNNGDDECKVESDTGKPHQRITCKS